MTSTQSQQDQLTDSEYIRWTEKQEWSLTQAVYLLQGFNPPKSNKTEKQLQRQFPDAENLLQRHKEWTEEVKKMEELSKQSPEAEKQKMLQWGLSQLKEGHPKCPEEWVGSASFDGLDLTDSWKAIFPMSVQEPLSFIHDEKPDYRRFVEKFTRDASTRLGELAVFVLGLNKYEKANPSDKFNDLLEDMNTALKINTKEFDKLASTPVSPRQFMNECPQHYFSWDNQCLPWVDWLTGHPELADMLKDSSSAKKVRSRTKNGNESLPEMGGNARAAIYALFKQQVIKLYREGEFKSKLQASKDLRPQIEIYRFDKQLKIPAPQPSTIYRWLRELGK